MVDDTPTARRAFSAHWVWLVLLAAAFGPTAVWLWERWTLSVWHNGHGIFVAPVVGYLVWDTLKRDPVTETDASPWGFVFLVPSLALLALDTAIRTEILAAIALVGCLPGLSLLLLGVQRTRQLAVPLLLAAFMLPVPAGLLGDFHLALRTVSAWGTAELAQLWGIPVFREATRLTLPSHLVEVVDACSGFSTLYASLFLSVVLMHRAESTLRRAALLVTAPVLAVSSNVVRVFVLVLIVHYLDADLLETALHETSGMATFVIVLIGLIVVAEWRAPRAPAPEP